MLAPTSLLGMSCVLLAEDACGESISCAVSVSVIYSKFSCDLSRSFSCDSSAMWPMPCHAIKIELLSILATARAMGTVLK